MNKHIKIIITQTIFLTLVLLVIYLAYPKASVSVNGNFVSFNSINAKVISISENPDFSNPRYFELKEGKNISFSLEPGTYYWKASNGYIKGQKNKFVIESKVGLKITRDDETELVNIGNVRVNITKSKEGIMIGHIILQPDESEKINDSGNYEGRQT